MSTLRTLIRPEASCRAAVAAVLVLCVATMAGRVSAFAAEGDFDPRSFGAKFDGRSDDTAAIQHAIDAAVQAGSGRVKLPGGARTVISRTLAIDGAGIDFDGGGGGMSVNSAGMVGGYIKWNGPAGIPMLKLSNAFGIRLHDLTLLGNPKSQPSTAIELYDPSNHRFPREMGHFSNIFMGYSYTMPGGIDQFRDCIQYTPDGEDGVNNGPDEWVNIHCASFSNIGIDIPGVQFIGEMFDTVEISGSLGRGGERAAIRVGALAVAFHNLTVIGVGGQGAFILTRYSNVDVVAFAGEHNARLVTCEPVRPGNHESISFTNGYFQAWNGMAGPAIVQCASEGRDILNGSLTFRNFLFTNNTGQPFPSAPMIRLGNRACGGKTRLVLDGVDGLEPASLAFERTCPTARPMVDVSNSPVKGTARPLPLPQGLIQPPRALGAGQ